MSDNSKNSGQYQSPSFWEANKYRICIVDGDSRTWFDPDKPFALIGAASCCDVQLVGNIPPVAYFVCCLRGRIEVWPTAALAYPRWGVVSPNIDLLVGHTRITLHSEDDQSSDPNSPDINSEAIRCKIKYHEKSVKIMLRRSVTLVGDSHPSTLRLRDQGLERCHFAMVVQDSSLWIVNVSAATMPPHERVQSLQDARDLAQVVDTKIQLISDSRERTIRAISEKAQPKAGITRSEPLAEKLQTDPMEDVSPDVLSTILTDRLINKSRSLWRRPLLVLVLVAALGLITFLWFNLLQKIYQEWF